MGSPLRHRAWSFLCHPTVWLGPFVLRHFLGVGKPLRLPSHHLPFIDHRSPFTDTFQKNARVVEWQTRTFEGRMPKGMRVQVPPRALLLVNNGRFQTQNDDTARLDRAFRKKIIDRSVSTGTFQQITLSPPPTLSAFPQE
jgi:hypothetical protein